VLAAPFPTAIVKKIAREQVSQMIEAGKPDVSGLLDRCDPIVFPTKRLGVAEYGGSAAAVHAVDAASLMAWLHQKDLLKAIDGLIDEAGDDAAALSPEQRIEKLTLIDADILASERDECAFAELAGLLPRADIDARAALGLHSDMPAPRRN
jgi:hypothetical protein